MPDRDLPQGTADDAALSFDDGVDALIDLSPDPETDPGTKDQGQNEAKGVEGETPEDDPEAGDGQEDPDLEQGDGPDDIKGGRFAPDSAKVKLEDGTVITVADLRRNNLFQRDYSRKTEELKRERETFAATRGQHEEYAQTLATQRDLVLHVAQQMLPQAPDKALRDVDPFGYRNALDDYNEQMSVLNNLAQQQQAVRQRQADEMQRSTYERRAAERDRLMEAMPELKNPETYRKFWTDAVDTLAEFGFTPEEVGGVDDHRFYKVFRELSRWRRTRNSAPAVKEQVQRAPVIQGGRRMDTKGKTSQQRSVRAEQLRTTGSFEAGIASLMDIPDL